MINMISHRIFYRFLVAIFTLTTSITACRERIFEDRVDCDATVCLRTPESDPIPSGIAKSVYLRIFDDGFLGESSSVSPDALNKGILFMRPKGSELRWSTLMNWPGDEHYWRGRSLVIPDGAEFPKAYGDYFVSKLTEEDYQECIVEMQPLFSLIKVSVSGEPDMKVEFQSNFGGYKDPELDVVEGSFVRKYNISGEGEFTVPNIFLNDTIIKFEGKSSTYVFDLNEYFKNEGFVGNVLDDSPICFDFVLKDGRFVSYTITCQSEEWFWGSDEAIDVEMK